MSEKMREVVYVDVDSILIPEDRVTSMMEPETMEELRESIRQYGILQPLQLAKVDNKLVLIDGLHRLIVAKELGIRRVPAIVQEMSERDLLITNLIVNRQRGKSNPAHEAKVLRKLVEEYNMSLAEAAEKLGMSRSTAEKYYQIALFASPRVMQYLEEGLLSVGCAYWLSFITDREKQDRYAEWAVQYNYTVEQCKAAAYSAESSTVPESVRFIITPEGQPKPRPIPVYPCGQEVEPENVAVIQIDKRVWPLLEQAFKQLCSEGFFGAAGENITQEQGQQQAAQPAPAEQNKEEKKGDWFNELLAIR